MATAHQLVKDDDLSRPTRWNRGYIELWSRCVARRMPGFFLGNHHRFGVVRPAGVFDGAPHRRPLGLGRFAATREPCQRAPQQQRQG